MQFFTQPVRDDKQEFIEELMTPVSQLSMQESFGDVFLGKLRTSPDREISFDVDDAEVMIGEPLRLDRQKEDQSS